MCFKTLFYDTLKTDFAPRLRDVGFRGSGQNFRRVRDEIINTVNIQGARWGGKCVLNIGLHATFLPLWSDQLPDTRTIKEIDCEFRGRVTPSSESDFWWEYGTSPSFAQRSAWHMIETYFSVGEQKFQRFSSLDSIAAMYPIELLARENASSYSDNAFGYIPLTIPRVALAMARIHEHLGNHSLAKDFAIKGLSHVGRAASLAPHFQRIIDAG